MGMEEHHTDDQSHYEISLTAGQAFVAFVLLLLSLAASFAFGLMLGKGQADERLVVRKETPVVTEAALVPKKTEGRIVELGVDNDDFQATESASSGAAKPAAPVTTDSSASTAIVEDDAPVTAAAPAPVAVTAEAKPASAATDIKPAKLDAPVVSSTASVPYLAQLLSTGDQKTAEALAVKVINRGFNTAYVERGSTEKGAVYRVRVRFDSEAAARAAEPKLREFSKDVWITAK